MTMTAAATTEITTHKPRVSHVLALKTGFTGATTWKQYAFEKWTLSYNEDAPDTLDITLCNDSMAFSDEDRTDTATRTIIGADVRFTAYVGAPTTYAIIAVSTVDKKFTIDGDHVADFDGSVIFDVSGSTGNDKVYTVVSAALAAGDTEITVADTIPDATVDGSILVVEHECKFEGTIKRVTPDDYSFSIFCADPTDLANSCTCEVDLEPTTVVVTAADETFTISNRAVTQIDATLGLSYGFAVNGSGTDPAFDQATQTRRRSWKRTNTQLWRDSPGTLIPDASHLNENPAWEDYHGEVPPKHYSIDYESGAIKLLEQNTYSDPGGGGSPPKTARNYYVSDVTAYLESAATGATNVDFARLIEQAWQYAAASGGAGLTAGQCDFVDTGLDIGYAYYFRGKLSDFMADIRKRGQVNLKTWWDHGAHKLKVRLVTQKAAASEDWTMVNPSRISQPRDDNDLYTRVMLTGESTLPVNEVNVDTISAGSDTTGGDWFPWNGNDAAATASWEAVRVKLFDGDANLGASVMGLSLDYSTWYEFVVVDMGSTKRVDYIRLHMPGSRNPNKEGGDQRDATVGFWPGIKVQGSTDGITYYLMSPLLYGHFEPHAVVEARGNEILRPKVRYVRVMMNPYKHGFKGQNDPSIGLAELEIFTSAEYEVIREIDSAAAPASVYNYTNGTTWTRNFPNLWTRFGSRFRTFHDNIGHEYDEFLAGDVALNKLSESIRLFQEVEYTSVCDPRIRLYDTVVITDELNGNVASILVTNVTFTQDGTTVRGTDYLSAAAP